MGVPVIKHHCHTKNTTSIHLFSFSKKHATECHQTKKSSCHFHQKQNQEEEKDCCTIDTDLIKNTQHALINFDFEVKPNLFLSVLFISNTPIYLNSFFTSNYLLNPKEKPPLLYGSSFRIAIQSFLC